MPLFRWPTSDEALLMTTDQLVEVFRGMRSGKGWDESLLPELPPAPWAAALKQGPTTLEKMAQEQRDASPAQLAEIAESGRASSPEEEGPSLSERMAEGMTGYFAAERRRDAVRAQENPFAGLRNLMAQTREEMSYDTPFDQARREMAQTIPVQEYQAPAPPSPFPGFASVARTFPGVMAEGMRSMYGRGAGKRRKGSRRRR